MGTVGGRTATGPSMSNYLASETMPIRLPLKPGWIHDLLILWRRNQSLALLLERTCDYTAQEIRSASVRRAVLTQAAAYFVETRGSGKALRTTQQNVWATYSRNFTAESLAPALLVHLLAQWPLALELAASLNGRLAPGEALDDALIAAVTGAEPDGGRPVELDACLRTLHYFGVLSVSRNRGRYRFAGRLPVAPTVFPLLVWSWWQREAAATIDLAAFALSPLFAFVNTDDFAASWAVAAGKVWTLDAAGARARLLPVERAAFVRALLNLLSTDGRRGRNQPRDNESRDNEPHESEPPEAAALATRSIHNGAT